MAQGSSAPACSTAMDRSTKKKQQTGWQEDWLAAGKLSMLFSLVYATMIHSFFKMFKT